MIFYYNNSGELISEVPSRVFQGSQNVSSIYFVSPVLSGNTVKVSFTLPNGESVTGNDMTLLSSLSGEVIDIDDNTFSVYEYKLPFLITKYDGNVLCQFSIYSINGDEVLTTESVEIIVERGVLVNEIRQLNPINMALDFDESETKTNFKSIDEKDVYKKAFNFSMNVSSMNQYVINIESTDTPSFVKIVKSEGEYSVTKNDSVYFFPINTTIYGGYEVTTNSETYFNVFSIDGVVKVQFRVPVGQLKATFNLYYTKE